MKVARWRVNCPHLNTSLKKLKQLPSDFAALTAPDEFLAQFDGHSGRLLSIPLGRTFKKDTAMALGDFLVCVSGALLSALIVGSAFYFEKLRTAVVVLSVCAIAWMLWTKFDEFSTWEVAGCVSLWLLLMAIEQFKAPALPASIAAMASFGYAIVATLVHPQLAVAKLVVGLGYVAVAVACISAWVAIVYTAWAMSRQDDAMNVLKVVEILSRNAPLTKAPSASDHASAADSTPMVPTSRSTDDRATADEG